MTKRLGLTTLITTGPLPPNTPYRDRLLHDLPQLRHEHLLALAAVPIIAAATGMRRLAHLA